MHLTEAFGSCPVLPFAPSHIGVLVRVNGLGPAWHERKRVLLRYESLAPILGTKRRQGFLDYMQVVINDAFCLQVPVALM